MQLIEETVSPHLRELELSFYGNAKGSSRDSITLLGQWRREAWLGGSFRLSREMSFAIPGNDGSGLTADAIAPVLIEFLGICAPTELGGSQTHRDEVLPVARNTALLKSKARGDGTSTPFLIVFALSPSSSQVPVLPCVVSCSFLSSGFAVAAVQLPS